MLARALSLSLSLSRAHILSRALWRAVAQHAYRNLRRRLPHATQNPLDLPPYRDADTMRDKLLVAVRECGEGFGFA